MPPTQVPPFLLAEYLIGLFVAAAVARDRLVLMRRVPDGGDGGTGAAAAAGQQQGRPER